MFVKYLFVGQVLTDTCIDLVKNSQLNRRFIVDFDVPACLDRPFKSAREDSQISPFFLVLYEFVQHYRQRLGILFSLF